MTRPQLRQWRLAVLAVCLFGFVVGANWDAFDRYSSDIPNWDQWDAEGENLLLPWFQRDHVVAHIFQPHNEHRVVLTKLQNLAVVLLSGQWDARLEGMVNALLHAAIAVGFWALGRRWLARRWHGAWYVLTAALFALPFAWQNVLGGFHSQQYWLTGLSSAAIVLLPFAAPGSPRWWCGLAAAVLAMGAMGSGFFAAAVVLGVVVWRVVHRQAGASSAWTVAAMAALVAAAWWTRVDVPLHAALKAHSLHDFALSVVRSLAWPVRGHDWLAAVLWAPFAAVLIRLCTASGARSHFAQLAGALGGWVLLQVVAAGLVRGAGGDYPASRYMDTLIIGALVNALIAGRALTEAAAQRKRVPSAALLAAAWTAAFLFGAVSLLSANYREDLPHTRWYYDQAENHLRNYLATNNPAELSDPIPYPVPGPLIERLSHPELRKLMPASVRPPLALRPAAGSTGFVEHWARDGSAPDAPAPGIAPAVAPLSTRPAWGSFGTGGAQSTGTWRSEPVSADLHGWLRFEMAGSAGTPGLALELRDAASGAVLTQITPRRRSGTGWQAAWVKAPRQPFVVEARDANPHGWFAFTAPVEASDGSRWAAEFARCGWLIALLAAAGACAAALWPETREAGR